MSLAANNQPKPATHRTPPRGAAKRNFLTALSNWVDIILTLMVDELNRRTKAGPVTTAIRLAEPFILITFFYLIRFVVRGSLAPYGSSTLLFLCSGVLPFYLFFRMAALLRTEAGPAKQLPRSNTLDMVIGGAAATAIIWLFAIVLALGILWMYGVQQARPVSVMTCLFALLMLGIIGIGFGLINLALERFITMWGALSGFTTRGLLFLSGVIQVADFYGTTLRYWVSWNPLLHGVDLFRVGVYGSYPHLILDELYLVKSAVVFLFVGIIAERATLRYRGEA